MEESRDPWISKEHILTAPVTRPLPLSLSHTDERGAVGIRVLAVLPARESQAAVGRAKKKVSHQEERQFLLSPSVPLISLYLESDKPQLDAIELSGI